MAPENMNDKELEAIMNTRYVPEMRSNLAERIIEASKHHESQGRRGASLWFNTFWDALLLPKPAYVLAGLFVLAVLLGGMNEYLVSTDGDVNLGDYIYTAEDVTEGDWL